MRLNLTILASLVVLPVVSALAEEDCSVPMAEWKPREAVASMATDLGWIVHRIKIDDGCYEIIGTDAGGAHIEATVDPATLQVIEIESDDHDDSSGVEAEEQDHDE